MINQFKKQWTFGKGVPPTKKIQNNLMAFI